MNSCSDCRYYHGRSYGGNSLVCAIHPYGTDRECLDFALSKDSLGEPPPACLQLFESGALSEKIMDSLCARTRILSYVSVSEPRLLRPRILPFAILEAGCHVDTSSLPRFSIESVIDVR